MKSESLCAIYDFELFPFSLGDVLTWNVQTAIRCEELGRKQVDRYICMDAENPAFVFQRDMITSDNCELFFSELFGAFGTHPTPGGIFIYHDRREMLARLKEVGAGDEANSQIIAEYEWALGNGGIDQEARDKYFLENVYSHERINAFVAKYGRVPQLRPSGGCAGDVSGLMNHLFSGKKIVVAHMRLRRLDAGYGGALTYARDSDVVEWYEFLKEAGKTHPDVVFVLAGRIQEKPIEFLRLQNAVTIRSLGLGLGHELSLILRSDLFMGSSSGFAAMANFSNVPYFITNMTNASCAHYGIESGCDRLPFASEKQILVYGAETRDLLMTLLERGLGEPAPRSGSGAGPSSKVLDVRSWEWQRSRWLHPGSTTYRFVLDDDHCDKETAFLVWPKLKQAALDSRSGREDRAWNTLQRIEDCFPRMCIKYPEFLRLKMGLARKRGMQKVRRSAGQGCGYCPLRKKRIGVSQRSLRDTYGGVFHSEED